MAKTERILCEVCHERLATCHICNGNTGKSSHLCAECFETSAAPEVRKLAAIGPIAHGTFNETVSKPARVAQFAKTGIRERRRN
jgi:hypothetical protein